MHYPFTKYVLMLTARCNMRCTYCYGRVPAPRFQGDMSDEVLKMCAERCVETAEEEIVTVDFFGGEPLLRFDLVRQFVEYVDGRVSPGNIVFLVSTNGTLLTNEMLGWMANNKIRVAVTLDGPEAVHDSRRVDVHGNGTWKTVISNLRNLRQYGIVWSLISTITKNSCGSGDIIDYLSALKVKSATVRPVFTTQEELMWNDSDIPLIKKDGEDFARKYIQHHAADKSRQNTVIFPAAEMLKIARNPGEKPRRCTAGTKTVAVAPDGTLFPCQRLVGYSDFNLGAIQGPFKTIMETPWKEKVASMNNSCQSCDIYSFCSGPCIHKAYHHDHATLAPHYLFCEWRKAIAGEIKNAFLHKGCR